MRFQISPPHFLVISIQHKLKYPKSCIPIPIVSQTLEELTVLSDKLLQHYSSASIQRHAKPWSTEDLMQGFVGDVGDLMKLVMAKSGKREIDSVDEKLAHELADCLWSVLLLAKAYQVNLGKELERMVAQKLVDAPPFENLITE